MATSRAKRMSDYLTNQLGWEVKDNAKKCKCGAIDYVGIDKFCRACGKPMPKKPNMHNDAYEELEAAIAYALKERKQ